ITEALSVRFSIPTVEAEELKRRVGVLPDQNAAVVEAVAEAIRPLVSELRSSFEYLASGDPKARVASLGLSGGSAMLPGLVNALGAELGIEVFLADPLMRLRESRHRGYHDELTVSRSSAAVSVGLALAMAS